MELLIWTGKVSLYWLFFYGCFYFFLRKLTHFRWNRAYLLTTLILSPALPFVRMPQATTETLAAYTVQLDAMSILPQAEASSLSWMELFAIAYFAIVIFFLFRLAQRFVALNRIWKSALLIEADDSRVKTYILPDNNVGSFSFFNRIAISQADYFTHFDEILSHEMVHVKQRHSFDILLIEILSAFFWFHPILPLYRKSLQEVHEYLADERTGNRDTYAEFLISYTFGLPRFLLVNSFCNSSLLKQRIQMLYQHKSSKWKFALYGFTGVVAFALITLVAACSDDQKVGGEDPVVQMDVPLIIPNVDPPGEKIFTAVEKNPDFPGGVAELYKFLNSNIRYPASASRAGVTGRVFLQFVVRTDGSISDVMVVKGIGFGCDEEAIRVAKAMPKWDPGRQNGIPVNVRYTLPINFQLEGAEEAAPKTDPAASSSNPDVQPLFVVDGRIMTDMKDLKDFEKSKGADIESITVLKHKGATDKYGDKGKDGVIEIALKKR